MKNVYAVDVIGGNGQSIRFYGNLTSRRAVGIAVRESIDSLTEGTIVITVERKKA